MVRSVPLLLLITLAATPAAGQSATSTEIWRIHDTATRFPDQLPATHVGSGGRFGFGVFGPKSQTPRNRAVIGYELSTPKQRRAGVGFSLKF